MFLPIKGEDNDAIDMIMLLLGAEGFFSMYLWQGWPSGWHRKPVPLQHSLCLQTTVDSEKLLFSCFFSNAKPEVAVVHSFQQFGSMRSPEEMSTSSPDHQEEC